VNLKGRIGKLEHKLRPGNGLHVIVLEDDETHDHADHRYCAENDILIDELRSQGPDSLIIYIDKSGGANMNDAGTTELEQGNESQSPG
jgi:hypothetical protein